MLSMEIMEDTIAFMAHGKDLVRISTEDPKAAANALSETLERTVNFDGRVMGLSSRIMEAWKEEKQTPIYRFAKDLQKLEKLASMLPAIKLLEYGNLDYL